MTVARQGMPRQQLQQQSGITSHMEMLRLFGVVRSVFQHSGWVTARCVEKTQGQFWPLIQEKMACEGEDVMRRNCLPAVHKFRLTANADTSERHKQPPLHTAICAQGQVFGRSRDTINAWNQALHSLQDHNVSSWNVRIPLGLYIGSKLWQVL